MTIIGEKTYKNISLVKIIIDIKSFVDYIGSIILNFENLTRLI